MGPRPEPKDAEREMEAATIQVIGQGCSCKEPASDVDSLEARQGSIAEVPDGVSKLRPEWMHHFEGVPTMRLGKCVKACLIVFPCFLLGSVILGYNEQHLKIPAVRGVGTGTIVAACATAIFSVNAPIIANGGWHNRYYFPWLSAFLLGIPVSCIHIQGRPLSAVTVGISLMTVGFQICLLVFNGTKPGCHYRNAAHKSADLKIGNTSNVGIMSLIIGLTVYNALIQNSNEALLGLMPTVLFVICRLPYTAMIGGLYCDYYDKFTAATAQGDSEPPFTGRFELVLANIAAFGGICFQVGKAAAVMLDAAQSPHSKRWVVSCCWASFLSVMTRSGLLHRAGWAAAKSLKLEASQLKMLGPCLCPGSVMAAGVAAMYFVPILYLVVFGIFGLTRAVMTGNLEAMVFADVSQNMMMAFLLQFFAFVLENLALKAIAAVGQLKFPRPEHIPGDHPLCNFSAPPLPLQHATVTVTCLLMGLWMLLFAIWGPNFALGLCTKLSAEVPERWLALEATTCS